MLHITHVKNVSYNTFMICNILLNTVIDKFNIHTEEIQLGKWEREKNFYKKGFCWSKRN